MDKDLAILLHKIEDKLFSLDLDPVIQYNLQYLPLVQNKSESKSMYIFEEIVKNKWIHQLITTQHMDGSWGRFHSQDTRVSQVVPTTEYALCKATFLGLDTSISFLQRAKWYLLDAVDKNLISDPPEKNLRWPIGVNLFLTAMIVLIEPDIITRLVGFHRWKEILTHTFASGFYNSENEREIHRKTTGLTKDFRYLQLNSKYHLILFSKRYLHIPLPTLSFYEKWLWNQIGEIRYSRIDLRTQVNQIPRFLMMEYIYYWNLLSNFPQWKKQMQNIINWLINQRDSDGFWDFGSCSDNFWKISSQWTRKTRKIDQTFQILRLIKRYLEK